MPTHDRNDLIRNAAFEFLKAQVAAHGDALPWKVLHDGFTFEGRFW